MDEDLWYDANTYDPWAEASFTAAARSETAQYGNDEDFNGVATELDFGPNLRSGVQTVKKEDHDRPPIWDGQNPDKMLDRSFACCGCG